VDYVSVSQAARELGAKPKSISDLLYQRELQDELCPIIAGRRLIPRTYLPAVRRELLKRGLLATPVSESRGFEP
jgi:hypothetical protein